MEVSILFVCTGNICRSPTAEGVFRNLVGQNNLGSQVRIDSAGTHNYHAGESPDKRSQQAAKERGVDLSKQRARQLTAQDFAEFDYVLLMDNHNYLFAQQICPIEHRTKLKYFLEFAPQLNRKDVPDPYYSGQQGFEEVLDMIEIASQGLLDHLIASGTIIPNHKDI